MGKIRSVIRKMSIKASFMAYMLGCILIAVFLALFLSNLCQAGQVRICKKYKELIRKHEYKISNVEHGEDGDEIFEFYVDDIGTLEFYAENITSLFTPLEDFLYNVFGFLSIGVYPLCFVFCMGMTSLLFYRRQLKKPLEILDNAADNIAGNNLDFRIVYNRQNELGKLCDSFEKMRGALYDNNVEMWRQIEERKALNAAFAHDLRTPLTVLKGQSEMLIRYAPQMTAEKIAATAEMMQRHIIRLEAYVNTMNQLKRLEDIDVNKALVSIKDVISQMLCTGETVRKEKKLSFSSEISSFVKMNLDMEIIMRVYENLLSNALRFAKENIVVSVKVREDFFYLIVSDDGKGFSEKDLTDAVKPFYKSAKESDGGSFGMGLNICKILCEKHGGSLKLENAQGALVTAVFKQ